MSFKSFEIFEGKNRGSVCPLILIFIENYEAAALVSIIFLQVDISPLIRDFVQRKV